MSFRESRFQIEHYGHGNYIANHVLCDGRIMAQASSVQDADRIIHALRVAEESYLIEDDNKSKTKKDSEAKYSQKEWDNLVAERDRLVDFLNYTMQVKDGRADSLYREVKDLRSRLAQTLREQRNTKRLLNEARTPWYVRIIKKVKDSIS